MPGAEVQVPAGTSWAAAEPEWQPPMSLRFAGLAWRTGALLIDATIIAVYWWVVIYGPWAGSINGPVLTWIAILPTLVYFPLSWGRFGTTIGMRLLGLRIVRGRDGGPIGYGAAVVRFLIVLVLVAVSAVLVGLGLLTLPLVLDRRRRGLYDRAAGTVVTRPAYRSQPSL